MTTAPKPRKANARPAPTADHLISAKKPVTVREYFGVDEDDWTELENAKQALQRARVLDDGSEPARNRLKIAQEKADAARDAVRAGSVEVVMRSVGRGRWEKLKEAYPATDEQQAKLKETNPDAVLEYNPDTFPVAAIAASCVQPELTEEQVQEIWDSPDWNEEECARLLQMAMQANSSRRVANLAF